MAAGVDVGPSVQTLTTLASFNGSNGEWPYAGVTLSGNILYGTAYGGGANNDGDVFSVPLSGGSPTVLASFNGGSVSDPWQRLLSQGRFDAQRQHPVARPPKVATLTPALSSASPKRRRPHGAGLVQ